MQQQRAGAITRTAARPTWMNERSICDHSLAVLHESVELFTPPRRRVNRFAYAAAARGRSHGLP